MSQSTPLFWCHPPLFWCHHLSHLDPLPGWGVVEPVVYVVLQTHRQAGHKVGTRGNAVAVKVGVLGFWGWELTTLAFQLLPLLTDLLMLLTARGKIALEYTTTPTP